MAGVRKLIRSHGLPLAFLGVSGYFLASIILEKGYSLTTEDDLFETFTAVFYAVASLLCLVGFATARGRVASVGRYATLGWAALFFLFAMEEVSWGQRILGLETPGFLVTHNLQEEINLHNFASHDVNRLFYASVFLVGMALPFLAMLKGRVGSLIGRWGVPLPQSDLIVPFALASAFVSLAWVAMAPEAGLLIAIALLAFAFALKSDSMERYGMSKGLSKLHLWMGLGGVGLIQIVLKQYEDNLGHINQPIEIKEFLFSACFLVFAFRVGGISRLPVALWSRASHGQSLSPSSTGTAPESASPRVESDG